MARWEQLKPLAWEPFQCANLAAYCASYGRWVDAEAFLTANGLIQTISDDKGNVKSHGPSPHLLISERAQKEMGRLAGVLRLALMLA